MTVLELLGEKNNHKRLYKLKQQSVEYPGFVTSHLILIILPNLPEVYDVTTYWELALTILIIEKKNVSFLSCVLKTT